MHICGESRTYMGSGDPNADTVPRWRGGSVLVGRGRETSSGEILALVADEASAGVRVIRIWRTCWLRMMCRARVNG